MDEDFSHVVLSNGRPLVEALYCDCETALDRAVFFASGRAWETGIVAKSLEQDIAKLFFEEAERQLKEEASESPPRFVDRLKSLLKW